MIAAVTTGWIVAILGALVASMAVSLLAGKATSTRTVDELEARRLAHLERELLDENGGGAA